jgi:hypothetical protein
MIDKHLLPAGSGAPNDQYCLLGRLYFRGHADRAAAATMRLGGTLTKAMEFRVWSFGACLREMRETGVATDTSRRKPWPVLRECAFLHYFYVIKRIHRPRSLPIPHGPRHLPASALLKPASWITDGREAVASNWRQLHRYFLGGRTVSRPNTRAVPSHYLLLPRLSLVITQLSSSPGYDSSKRQPQTSGPLAASRKVQRASHYLYDGRNQKSETHLSR